MKYLKLYPKGILTFENFTSSTLVSKGAMIEEEKEKQDEKALEMEKLEKELEEDLEKEEKTDKKKKL